MLQARLIDDLKGSPTLLFWGDNADMATLLDHLRGLDTDRPVARIGQGENTVTVNFSALSGRSHIKSGATACWECSEDTIARTADLIGPLLNAAGHQFVDADGHADVVVISANEYPPGFA